MYGAPLLPGSQTAAFRTRPCGSRASIGVLYPGSNNAYGRPACATLNPDGGIGLMNANVLPPRTIRFMYRQSIGGGTIFERERRSVTNVAGS